MPRERRRTDQEMRLLGLLIMVRELAAAIPASNRAAALARAEAIAQGVMHGTMGPTPPPAYCQELPTDD